MRALALLLLAGPAAADVTADARALQTEIRASGLALEIWYFLELEVPSPGVEVKLHGLEARASVPLAPFAMDGSGGIWFLVADGRILLADSEGQAAVMASDFTGLLEVGIGLPSPRDALYQVGCADPALEEQRYLAWWAEQVALFGAEPGWAFVAGDLPSPTPEAARAALADHFGLDRPARVYPQFLAALRGLSGDIDVLWDGNPSVVVGRCPGG